jgi:hypothetical protein
MRCATAFHLHMHFSDNLQLYTRFCLHEKEVQAVFLEA